MPIMPVDFGLELQPPAGYSIFKHNLESLDSLSKYFSTIWICDHFQYAGDMP